MEVMAQRQRGVIEEFERQADRWYIRAGMEPPPRGARVVTSGLPPRQRRLRLGLSVSALAKEAGVDRGTLSALESGGERPARDATLGRVQTALDRLEAAAQPSRPRPLQGPDDGHTFRISVAVRGSSLTVGDEHHRDAGDFEDLETSVEVRAWNLSEALVEASLLSLDHWFPEEDEDEGA